MKQISLKIDEDLNKLLEKRINTFKENIDLNISKTKTIVKIISYILTTDDKTFENIIIGRNIDQPITQPNDQPIKDQPIDQPNKLTMMTLEELNKDIHSSCNYNSNQLTNITGYMGIISATLSRCGVDNKSMTDEEQCKAYDKLSPKERKGKEIKKESSGFGSLKGNNNDYDFNEPDLDEV